MIANNIISDDANKAFDDSNSSTAIEDNTCSYYNNSLALEALEEEYFTPNVIFKDTVLRFIPETRGKLDAFLVDTIREEPGASQVVMKGLSA